MTRIFILSAIFLSLPLFAHAAETQPGEACPTAGIMRDTGGPEQIPGRTLICNGTTWQIVSERATDGKTLFQINNDTGACTTAKAGRLRYDGTVLSICNGTSWAPFTGGGGGWIYGY